VEETFSGSSKGVLHGLQDLKLPPNVVQLLQFSCKDSTWNRYQSTLAKFREFCIKRKTSPFRPDISIVLSFLTELYESGLSYSSINAAKSALSTCLGKVEDTQIGEHPLVVRLMKGVAKSRPPSAKYSTTWDVDFVLERYRKWEECESLDLYTLSIKLASMLALISGHRVQTLAAITIDNIKTENNVVKIYVSELLKTSRPGSFQPCIHIPKYHIEPKLCVASTLMHYISRTRTLRSTCKQLFLSTREPHKAVTSQTISKWLVKVLELSDIDISMYKGHSFRHASTSRAFSSGVKIQTIFDSASWSENSNVFFKYYNRPTTKCNPVTFGSSVLSYNKTNNISS